MPLSRNYAKELLDLAVELQKQPVGRPGKLSTARARRSVSTAYYALFHFILDEATRSLLGTHHDLRSRRRTLARVFTHAGIKKALDKITRRKVDLSVRDLLRPRSLSTGDFPAPDFARYLAKTFSEVRVKRHEADYDLNAPISKVDARITILKTLAAVTSWQAATTDDDRDFKHTLSVLMLLKGELRREA
jgi:uncharacterized protein (UPF0332 family)